jgi:hypothetical protein
MSPDQSSTLAFHLTEAATDLPDVDEAPLPGNGREWRREGRPFAAAPIPNEAHFRLDAPVAAAAVRTPDTEPSPRGDGWVVLRPPVLDGHAVDRAIAWFWAAWRRAEFPGDDTSHT